MFLDNAIFMVEICSQDKSGKKWKPIHPHDTYEDAVYHTKSINRNIREHVEGEIKGQNFTAVRIVKINKNTFETENISLVEF